MSAPTSTPTQAVDAAAARFAIAVLCIGGLAAALTQTMVVPIQSELPRLLGASAADTAWVITITLLTASVAMVVAGRLADLYGKQRILVLSAGVLAVGSAIAATADSLVPMLVGRGVQGLAMGFIPVGISLVREVAPPGMATAGTAAMSATMGIGGAVGLPLSAWIVQASNWHVLFWTSTVIAVGVMVLVWATIPQAGGTRDGSFDLIGALGLAAGLVTFLVGISKATAWGWGSMLTLGCVLGGVAILVAWASYELRQPEPLVDLRATSKRPVLLTNLAALTMGFGVMAQAVVVPQLLQMPAFTGYGLGQSILAAGLWMAPGGLMMLVFAPVSARIIDGAGAKVALMLGAGVLAVGYLMGAIMMSAPWQLLVASCVMSAGVAIGYAAMPTIILDNTPSAEAGAAVGLNALMRSVGGTVAAAVMGTMLASNTADFGGVVLPTQSAFVWCFVVGGVAAAAAIAVTIFAPRRTVPEVLELDEFATAESLELAG